MKEMKTATTITIAIMAAIMKIQELNKTIY